MLLVETAQGMIVEGRAFDIDDVILNTSGALIGYLLIGRRLGRALHPRRTHWYHRPGYGTAPEPEDRTVGRVAEPRTRGREPVVRAAAGPGQAGSSARAETPVTRCRAKVRTSSAVWSYAVT